MRKPKVSVVIPTRNEQDAVERVIDDTVEALERGFDYELILVDKSADLTAQRIRNKARTNPRIRLIVQSRSGYGQALYTGFSKAKGDYIAMLDADRTYTPKDLPRMFSMLIQNEADLVVGNRMPSRDAMTSLNRIGNLLITASLNLRFRLDVKDSQCGMRAFKKSFLERFAPEEEGMPFATEMLIDARRQGLRIRNLDTAYNPRVGKTKLNPVHDGLKIFAFFLKSV